MNLENMLKELHGEKDRLTEAIMVMERLALSNGVRRRGRPPGWLVAARGSKPTDRKTKRRFSQNTRQRMSIAQKKRWAAREGD